MFQVSSSRFSQESNNTKYPDKTTGGAWQETATAGNSVNHSKPCWQAQEYTGMKCVLAFNNKENAIQAQIQEKYYLVIASALES